MKKNLLHRFIIIIAVTLVALWIVIGPRRWPPTLADFTPQGINNTLRNNIRLGLDLRGGLHLVMQVQVAEYLTRLTGNVASGLQTAATEQGFAVQSVTPQVAGGEYRIVLEAGEGADMQKLKDEVPKRTNDFDPSAWTASVDGRRIIWEMSDAAKTVLGTQAVEQAKQIIDTRINAVGVAEPTLSDHGAQGSHQILLQMPGERDPERIKKTLILESRLELVHVISPQGMLQKYPTREAALQSIGGAETPTRKVYPYVERDAPAEGEPAPAQQPEPEWVVVESPNVIEGADLRDARSSQGEAGGDAFQINFDLKPRGAEKFGRWTGANIGNFMGVVLDDQVKSVATIQSQINDSGRITGSFTKSQAEDLSLTLRSGALPAKLVYLEERTVGASLGEDSIRAGVQASLAGLIFVIIFMVIYYRGAGINAVVALLLNTIITVAAMVWPLDAALTLPGIAGLILSVGMTVDTNVLIFERIREEMLTGKTIPSAVDQGFSRAFVTIIDTHVTTIVSSLFLFIFGSGPIRGFAITLIIGLVANLFSAVYVSRTIFMWVLSRKGRRAESLSI